MLKYVATLANWFFCFANPLILELLFGLGDVLFVALNLTLQRLDVRRLVVEIAARLTQLALQFVFLARLALRFVRLDLNILLQLKNDECNKNVQGR